MEGQDFNKKEVCFISYNSRGFSSLKIDFLKYLTSAAVVGNKIPIVCNQENFLLRDNSYKLTNALPRFQMIINPAVKKSHVKGRPKRTISLMSYLDSGGYRQPLLDLEIEPLL